MLQMHVFVFIFISTVIVPHKSCLYYYHYYYFLMRNFKSYIPKDHNSLGAGLRQSPKEIQGGPCNKKNHKKGYNYKRISCAKISIKRPYFVCYHQNLKG